MSDIDLLRSIDPDDLNDMDYLLSKGIQLNENEIRQFQRYERRLSKGIGGDAPEWLDERTLRIMRKIGFPPVKSKPRKALQLVALKWEKIKPTSRELFGFLIVAILSGFFCWLFVWILGSKP